jgi:hypothetical protein
VPWQAVGHGVYDVLVGMSVGQAHGLEIVDRKAQAGCGQGRGGTQ